MNRITRSSIQYWLHRAVSVGIAGVLFWSGVEHLKNPFAFLTSILRYRIIDGDLATVLAATLPVLQTTLAAMMVLGVSRRLTTVCATLLLSVFTAVQLSALLRGLEIGCGCFGAANDVPITTWTVSRVALLALFGWAAYVLDCERSTAADKITNHQTCSVQPFPETRTA